MIQRRSGYKITDLFVSDHLSFAFGWSLMGGSTVLFTLYCSHYYSHCIIHTVLFDKLAFRCKLHGIENNTSTCASC